MKDKRIAKNVLIATRVTPKIAEKVRNKASSMGLYASEYIRYLLIQDLKE